MTLSKEQLATRLCGLTGEVADKVFRFRKAADCFCNVNAATASPHWNWQHDEAVIEFIEQAVRGAIAMHELIKETDEGDV